MSSIAPSYFALEKKLTQVIHLKHILSLAQWDAATMLAAGSAKNRQREIATMASILHKITTDKELGKLIDEALQEVANLNEWQQVNLYTIKKMYDEAHCISPEMQRTYSIAAGECEFVWRTAKKNNDFKQLAPYLDRLFKIVREMASIKAQYFGKKPYDILLDAYNPDLSSQDIKTVYAVLKENLPGLIQEIMAKQAQEKVLPLTQPMTAAIQKEIGLRIVTQMGFSLDHGRLDTSAHPFCSGSNDDVRLTTRYDANFFLSGITSIIHEVGHGLYQQHLPKAYRDQPVGAPKGMSFHESQSIIMERQVGASMNFMHFLAGLIRDVGIKGKEYEAENLYKLLTRVSPSLIRVKADEATYPLHVILRFEIEEIIIEGHITAFDLPHIWNSKMKEYLGVTPTTDTWGCMQDIHWPAGNLGYFPAYTNGAIIASMLMQAVRKQVRTLDTSLKNGDFRQLNNFLTRNVRQFGTVKSTADLLKGATGYAQIQPAIFIDYLKKKYL